MGSTVILLLPADACRWRENLEPGVTTVMGGAIGDLAAPSA
jgi:hypothetical protein